MGKIEVQFLSFTEYRSQIDEATATSFGSRKTRMMLKDLSKQSALALKAKRRKQLQVVKRRLAISMNSLQRQLID